MQTRFSKPQETAEPHQLANPLLINCVSLIVLTATRKNRMVHIAELTPFDGEAWGRNLRADPGAGLLRPNCVF
jgi:hypothetical protein